jgi:hypothetical protein
MKDIPKETRQSMVGQLVHMLNEGDTLQYSQGVLEIDSPIKNAEGDRVWKHSNTYYDTQKSRLSVDNQPKERNTLERKSDLRNLVASDHPYLNDNWFDIPQMAGLLTVEGEKSEYGLKDMKMNGNGKITGIVFDPNGAEPDMPFEGGYNPSTGKYCFEPDTNDEFSDEGSPIIILIDGTFDKTGTDGDLTYLWYNVIGDGDKPRLKISQNDMMPVCEYRLDVDDPKWKDVNLREYIDGKLKKMADNALILDEEPAKLIEL